MDLRYQMSKESNDSKILEITVNPLAQRQPPLDLAEPQTAAQDTITPTVVKRRITKRQVGWQ